LTEPVDDPMFDLRLAVDALTHEVHRVEIIRSDDAKKSVVFKRTDAPLLEQLRAAISNMIGAGSGGKLARERTPLDVAAFSLYELIDGRVRSWLLDAGATASKESSAGEVLRAWFAKWQSLNPNSGLVARHESIVRGWEQQIRDILDPPKRIEITQPCPVCHVEWVNVGLRLPDGRDDPEDIEFVRVLTAVERDNLEESFAICRKCDTVWLGVSRMRALRIALDDAEATRRAETNETVVVFAV
jgi:hypothetical protein